MWKKYLAWALTVTMALAALPLCASFTAAFDPAGGAAPDDPPVQKLAELQAPAQSPSLPAPQEDFYLDVTEDRWYYGYIRTLYELGVLSGGKSFGPGESATRMEFARSLYRLHLVLGGEEADGSASPFTDIPAGGEESAAAAWASGSGVTQGKTRTEFGPSSPLSREQGCTFVVRFAAAEGLELVKTGEAVLFSDSGKVSTYARSAMAACQMAGILTGVDGKAEPGRALTRAQAAALLCRLYEAAVREVQPGQECVLLDAEAYLDLYKKAYVFGEPIPGSSPVDSSWFKDAAFVGDSITVGLQLYNSGVLDDATFLCTTSLSAPGALGKVTSQSRHPTYNGVKLRVEDAVAACGARNVYILLGINNMYSPVEASTGALVELIGLIQEKSPEANIILQSVTPLTATSTILSDTMNNPKIDRYNQIMREHCAENGWYYLDVASAVKDKDGNFDRSCCGDNKGMGIHFSADGVRVWENYLLTHVPEALK